MKLWLLLLFNKKAIPLHNKEFTISHNLFTIINRTCSSYYISVCVVKLQRLGWVASLFFHFRYKGTQKNRPLIYELPTTEDWWDECRVRSPAATIDDNKKDTNKVILNLWCCWDNNFDENNTHIVKRPLLQQFIKLSKKKQRRSPLTIRTIQRLEKTSIYGKKVRRYC